jgi:cathepsin L
MENVEAVVIDWVEKGAVSPVKNQGICGSGVLYATLGGVEGLSKVSTGILQIFSEQQLIDCAFGCTGSQAGTGYNYYKSHCNLFFT